MLTIEEYIARRKKEDNLYEFDLNARNDNMRICVNYVFEYFNNYLNITEAEERTILKDEKLEKYRKQFIDYDKEVADWLVRNYSEHGKQTERFISSILKTDDFFFLYNSDSEFRSLSYDCYAKLIKKLPFLKDQTEMLFLFIKEYQRNQAQLHWKNGRYLISPEIDGWTEGTWEKYQINLWHFVSKWLESFSDNVDLWPMSHRIKSQESWREYDYNYRQKSNLFNLDSLYRKMPKKPYTKGRKQEFEIIMMYYWIHSIGGDNEYWEEYAAKTLPLLSNN
ncbi:hypothetical protein [Anaerospora hongkongensis]|uniref:hypothetical protein n=1 Tax=Anaerospora hongkongensis TaxID=244830 RepID=UPI002FDA1577